MMLSIEKILKEILIVSSLISFYCFGFAALFEMQLLIYPGIFFSAPYFLARKKKIPFIFDRYYSILSISLVIGSILNLLVTSNSLGGSLLLIANLFLTFFIIDNIERIYFHSKLFVLITLSYISYKIFYLDIPPHEFYENFSRNIPGYYLVVWTIFYLYIAHINHKKLFILIPLIAFLISIFLIGRSSLGVLLILLLITIIFYLKRLPKFISVLFFILLIYFIIYLSNNIQIIELYLQTGFSKKGIDTQRYDIWESYFHNISIVEIFFGRDPFSVNLINMYDGVLHNSFLKFHSRMGISVLIFLGIFIRSIIKYINRNQYYLLFLILLLSSRLFFDSMNFISPLDFIFFTLMLYPLRNKNSITKNRGISHLKD
ncbi:hypothetical protein N9R47_04520 [Flavobacteriaceae bacterium]|nr:hypothetical protein [Flavobacteriaceae bacterium]